ncbi:MAG TPA: nuclear transport factor 2 family protein [Acidobacteriaceae bacterium]|nr:nuclear transport factor 2 family protein [Acidobacteriaceae bacterium]
MRRRPACSLLLKPFPPAVAALIVLASCHAAWALPHREKGEIHREIEALEQQWRQATVTNNIGEMNRLLADDYVGITSNGTVENKQQALAQRSAGTIRITKLDLTDTRVRVYGDTAVVTSQAQLEGTNGTSDIGGLYRYTRVYTRRLGEWKIVSFEASRIPDLDARTKNGH